MKITSVESFSIEIPISAEEQTLGYYHKSAVIRIRTDEGITGYGWSGIDADAAAELLLGKDPVQVERLVAHLDPAVRHDIRLRCHGRSGRLLDDRHRVECRLVIGTGDRRYGQDQHRQENPTTGHRPAPSMASNSTTRSPR